MSALIQSRPVRTGREPQQPTPKLKRSTETPSSITLPAIDWLALRAHENERVAIYGETFPGSLAEAGSDVLDWFTMDVAHEVLRTFAGAWPSLGGRERVRYQYWGLDTGVAVEFRG